MIRLSDKEKRDQRRINELGQRKSKCCLCNETDRGKLLPAKSSLLEEHHISGRHIGESIIVCQNCHTKLTNYQLDWPKDIFDKNKNPEMQAIRFFYGLADILEYLAILCRKYASILYNFITHSKVVN